MYLEEEICSYEWYSPEIRKRLERAKVRFSIDYTSCTLHIQSDSLYEPLTEDEKRQIRNYITIHNYPYYYNIVFDN